MRLSAREDKGPRIATTEPGEFLGELLLDNVKALVNFDLSPLFNACAKKYLFPKMKQLFDFVYEIIHNFTTNCAVQSSTCTVQSST